MKFTTAVAIAAAATVVAAETNAHRMARGLPPKAPIRRSKTAAPKAQASGGSGGDCNTGPVQCCNSVHKADESIVQKLLDLLGLSGIPGDTQVGMNCSPVSVIGSGGGQCNQEPVCCENNNFSGLINLGCSPININL
ncbi:fungal hydrophobin [Coniophora puteana RWD-64-598 SS2]|uniref:Hydrophobin n=1 Tax=Coniophora puteana (strain RWD-64-598) TaxID=741705 RepID=A0A5M3MLF5_CONPW|nr:fungal hydrophobin [Coniophora puteana RWD-64-598 SS2]EIW79624.1 fungal hydrophobin [Coniophora puteana RWD-64-598 SS2]